MRESHKTDNLKSNRQPKVCKLVKHASKQLMKTQGTNNLGTHHLFNSNQERDAMALRFAHLALAAGQIALDVLSRSEIIAREKIDRSLVTEADERIEAFLIKELAGLLPGVCVVAEEAVSRGETVRAADVFLLIDPIDGTKEFIAQSDEFTINIALIANNRPVIGVIFAPKKSRIWFAGATAYAADVTAGAAFALKDDWRMLSVGLETPEKFLALVSKSHMDADTRFYLSRFKNLEIAPVGSSLKFCLLAEGRGDFYPRFGPTMEWDTAAGEAILCAAGGAVLDIKGSPLIYGKGEESYRNGPFVAWRNPLIFRKATFC